MYVLLVVLIRWRECQMPSLCDSYYLRSAPQVLTFHSSAGYHEREERCSFFSVLWCSSYISLLFVFMLRCPISGAIMFASPHFRRERLEPGGRDGPGSPGTCATQATAAPVFCCVRTRALGRWPGRTDRTAWLPLRPSASLNSRMFLKGLFPWFLTGMFCFISPF